MTLTVDAKSLQDGTVDPSILLDSVISIAAHAGEIVMEHHDLIFSGQGISKKDDGSIVTLADKASSKYIVTQLNKLTPHIVAMSEENSAWPNTDHPYWAIDPLDGTKIFASGGTGFSVDIALMLHGKPALGVTCCPAHNSIYYTANGLPSYKKIGDQEPVRIETAKNPDITKLTCIFDSAHADIEVYKQTRRKLSSEFNLHLTETPLGDRPIPLNLMVAEGHVDCHIKTGRDPSLEGSGGYIWDNASTHLILKNAGGEMTDLFALKSGLEYPRSARVRMHGYMALGNPQHVQTIFANRPR